MKTLDVNVIVSLSRTSTGGLTGIAKALMKLELSGAIFQQTVKPLALTLDMENTPQDFKEGNGPMRLAQLLPSMDSTMEMDSTTEIVDTTMEIMVSTTEIMDSTTGMGSTLVTMVSTPEAMDSTPAATDSALETLDSILVTAMEIMTSTMGLIVAAVE